MAELTDAPDFDPIRLVTELNAGGVRYVIVGGVAGRILGSPLLTGDLDICYARDKGNLDALAAVLYRLGARLRGAVSGLPFRMDGLTIARGDGFTFTTEAGDLDILGTPAGTSGYEDLVRTAERVDLNGVTVLAASLEDLIRMKRAAGRPKDLIELEVLGALREEIENRRP